MELARRKNFTGLEKEVVAVERASASAEVLARRLLSVARKQPLRNELIDVRDWLEQEAPLIQMSLSERVRLRITSPTEIWSTYVDPTELPSALINLAVNAKDAMPNGGDFTIRCENVTVDDARRSLKPGEYVVIACSDSGVGMPSAVAQRAFEPLFTTKAASAGTGLGLAQVMAMCEQAGGTARIVSAEGEGTTVSLFLPRGLREADAKGTVTPAHTPAISESIKGSVLLVEDNEEVAAGLSAVLEVFG